MPGSRVSPKITERYRRDLDFRIAVNYCVDKGIPYSHFIGEKNVWDDYSRMVVMAHEIERLTTCPDCHTKREEWDEKQGGDRHAYYGEVFICPGCAEKEGKVNAEVVNNGGKAPDGLKVTLVTKEQRMADIERRNMAMGNGRVRVP